MTQVLKYALPAAALLLAAYTVFDFVRAGEPDLFLAGLTVVAGGLCVAVFPRLGADTNKSGETGE